MSKPDTENTAIVPGTIDAVVRTRSLREGHFRAGRRHETEAVDWPAGTYTNAELAQLLDDPDLETEVLPDFDFDDDQDPNSGEIAPCTLP
ncbi:MAG: hypothetical protein AB7U59_15330 [Desulfovibrionaceae bacterium]